MTGRNNPKCAHDRFQFKIGFTRMIAGMSSLAKEPPSECVSLASAPSRLVIMLGQGTHPLLFFDFIARFC